MEQPMPDTPTESTWSAPSADLLQSHCRQIEAYAAPDDGAGEPAGARLAKSPKAALTREDLPAVLQSLVERYEGSHPGTRLEPLRYVSTGVDAAVATTGDPLDGDVVSLSVTETIVDARQIQVWSRVLIARRTDGSQTQGHRG